VTFKGPGTRASGAVRLLLVASLIAAAGSALLPALERWVPAMKQNVLASDRTMSLPLIDQHAPKQVATATFALG
jgi:hypothetical protein